jgi:hypothetical protein
VQIVFEKNIYVILYLNFYINSDEYFFVCDDGRKLPS